MRKVFVLAALVIAITTMISTLVSTTAMADELLIKPGDYNENIIVLHQKLSELGVYKLRPESPWGPDSIEALRVIQSVMGLEETGNVTDQSELDTILNLEATDELKADIAEARIVDNLFTDPEYSAGAERTDNGYVFTTAVEDNRFSNTVWQVYGSEGHLGNIDTGKEGLTQGDFVFPYESGGLPYRIQR